MAANAVHQAPNTLSPIISSSSGQTGVILVAKFDYAAKEPHELELKKGDRLHLIDNSKQWWLVRRVESEQTGYVPSNYVKKEKKSLLEKIIPRRLQAAATTATVITAPSCISACPSEVASGGAKHYNHNDQPTHNQTHYHSSPMSKSDAPSISFIGRAIVKHKYTAVNPDELTLNAGVRVNIMEKFGDGWWKIAAVVVNEDGGGESNNQGSSRQQVVVGLYPSNYLQEEQTTLSTTPVSPLANNNNNSLNNSSSSTPTSKSSNNNGKLTGSSSSNNYYNETTTSPTTPQSNNQRHSHPNHIHNNHHHNQMQHQTSGNEESLSSNEKDIEYVRVIYAYHKSATNGLGVDHKRSSQVELSVERNEILRLVDDTSDRDESTTMVDQARIKCFNSQGLVGMVPSRCVEPIIMDPNTAAEFVFVRRPALVGPLAYNPWYFGNVTRHDAVALMNRYGRNGDYIVRDSDNGDFSITLRSENNNNKHFKVYYKDDRLMIGKRVFTSMQELLEHYHRNPIYDQNGEKLFLVQPFKSPSFETVFSFIHNNSSSR